MSNYEVVSRHAGRHPWWPSLVLALVFLTTGCTTGQQREESRLRRVVSGHVYQRPLAEMWVETAKMFQERNIRLSLRKNLDKPGVLSTSSTSSQTNSAVQYHFDVEGIRVGDCCSRISIYMVQEDAGRMIASRGRYMFLERLLFSRAEPDLYQIAMSKRR